MATAQSEKKETEIEIFLATPFVLFMVLYEKPVLITSCVKLMNHNYHKCLKFRVSQSTKI
jgi:hypothetical protein